MAKNHVRDGDTITWINNTAAVVNSGDPVLVGSTMLAVALESIEIGASGELATEEVWTLPKDATVSVAQGAALYWNAINKNLTTVSTSNTYAGYAWAAAATADTTVQIKLNAM